MTVTTVGTGEFTLQQAVTGTVTWPTGTGSGEIALWTWTASSPDIAPSATSFSFTSTADIDLDDSTVSSLSGDEYAIVILNWTSGADEVVAWISYHGAGAALGVAFALPLPTIFLTTAVPTMFYWNTSYEAWSTTPTTTDWTAEPVTTALGVRNADRYSFDDTQTDGGATGETDLDIWIDTETGILLKLTDVSTVDNNGAMDYVMTTNIDLVSCSFFSNPMMLIIIIAVVAVIVIIIIIFLLYWFILRKRK
jgi:hypothetical protein